MPVIDTQSLFTFPEGGNLPSTEEMCAFYNDVLAQIAANDRALVMTFLNGPATDEQRQAITTWSETMAAIAVATFAKHFDTARFAQ